MTKSINRRNFLQTSTTLIAAAGVKNALASYDDTLTIKQEFYEIRVYKTKNVNKMKTLDQYLENTLIPALGRIGINRIGVFTNMDEPNDYSFYLVIPYSTFEIFASVNSKLWADNEYMLNAKEYLNTPKDDPVFSRIKSTFFKAFKGMPVIEMPSMTSENKPRIFELRIYESHNEEKAALKVDMFNSGEIQIMRDTEMAPVFYGEALIGDNLPNLTYMLSASDREAHDEHWSRFGEHPEWKRMRAMPKYKDTVSNITNIFLTPTDYSQI